MRRHSASKKGPLSLGEPVAQTDRQAGRQAGTDVFSPLCPKYATINATLCCGCLTVRPSVWLAGWLAGLRQCVAPLPQHGLAPPCRAGP